MHSIHSLASYLVTEGKFDYKYTNCSNNVRGKFTLGCNGEAKLASCTVASFFHYNVLFKIRNHSFSNKLHIEIPQKNIVPNLDCTTGTQQASGSSVAHYITDKAAYINEVSKLCFLFLPLSLTF